MQKVRKKELLGNKKGKINAGTFAASISLFGPKRHQNLKDIINSRNGASKEVVKELDVMGLEMMSAYSELHKQSDTANSPQEYVTRETIIGCTHGEYPVRLDAVKDHGVITANGKPLLTCRDCQANINIPGFGKCSAEVKGGRKLQRPSNTKMYAVGDRWIYWCIPEPVGQWRQKESVLELGDGEDGKYSGALTAGACLACRHGGKIGIIEVPDPEVPEVDNEEPEKILPLESKWLEEHTDDSMNDIEYVSMEFLNELGWTEIADYFMDKKTGERSDWKRAYNKDKGIFEFDPDPEVKVHRRPINEQDVKNLNRVLSLYKINKSKELVCAFMSQISIECAEGAKMCEQVGKDEIQPLNTTRTEMKRVHEILKDYPYKFRGGGVIQITNVGIYKEVFRTVAEIPDDIEEEKLNKILDELAEQEYVGEEGDIMEKEKILTIGTEYVAYNYPWLSAGIFWNWKKINTKFSEKEIDGVIDAINYDTPDREGRIDAYEECKTTYEKYAENIPWETENE